jgi:uncharacterized membrane protein YesL
MTIDNAISMFEEISSSLFANFHQNENLNFAIYVVAMILITINAYLLFEFQFSLSIISLLVSSVFTIFAVLCIN